MNVNEERLKPPANSGKTPGLTLIRGYSVCNDLLAHSRQAPHSHHCCGMGLCSNASRARILSLGTFCCAAVCAAAVVIDLIKMFPNYLGDAFQAFLVHLYALVFILLLLISSLVQNSWLLRHFGFLQYSSGSGLFLIFVGSLCYWYADILGQYGGIASMVWGALMVVFSCAQRHSYGTHTEPLLLPAV